MPRKKVESFRFDPNEVSVDDLCRLGFSLKQAQSIDNYRKKGGHFRRKTDFARSYVVSDSIYRRLEKYIAIPLVDLNVADSAAFDGLPGIGGWFASKMIEHRTALGGYSYVEQLMDIYRFDQEKFDALADLVVVSPEYVTPYPIWTLPADSLRKHPYISDLETARAIVLYRENTPVSQWKVESLVAAGIFLPENAARIMRCSIADPEQ
jgi:DNA uptake protein ComE-like DNA-binding protein